MIGAAMVLGGRYRLESRIALGGMGEVWRAHDETLGRSVAVKLLKPEYAEDPTFVERFRAEARNTARLAHPGIAAVYDYGEVPVEGAYGNTGYLVMELVPGDPLSVLLHERGPLKPSETMSILGQTAFALAAAHERGVIHRDIKPGNLLITPDDRVKVTDFGIARATDEVPLTTTGMVLGTSFYLAPEQSAGRGVTESSDIYSLGVVGYECLAGRRPFQDSNPVTVALQHQMDPPPPLPASVPAPIAQLVYAALAKNPQERPSTGEFGRQALALADPASTAAMAPAAATTEVLGAERSPVRSRTAPVPVPPPTRPGPAAPAPAPRKRRPIGLFVLLGLVIAAAVLTGIVLAASQSKKPGTPAHAPSSPAVQSTPSAAVPTSPPAATLAPTGHAVVPPAQPRASAPTHTTAPRTAAPTQAPRTAPPSAVLPSPPTVSVPAPLKPAGNGGAGTGPGGGTGNGPGSAQSPGNDGGG